MVPRTIPAATDALASARRRELREVVADVAEDVRDLIAEEDHRDDDRDRNDRDDECIFDETLAFLFTHELLDHGCSFPSLCPCRQTQTRTLPTLKRIIGHRTVAQSGENGPLAAGTPPVHSDNGRPAAAFD
jgi:hypothetical protein